MRHEINIDKKIEAIINKATEHIMFMPADQFSVANFRNTISCGMQSLKITRQIQGYLIDIRLTENNTVKGIVTYTPINQVTAIEIGINSGDDIFDRTMKGI